MEKRIEICKVRAGDINTNFGNPRKVTRAKLEDLKESMETLGDFGVYLIDENNSIIGGNQRLKVVKEAFGADTILDCKRLIGYTKSELRAINLKDNTHSGEWDLDMLADYEERNLYLRGLIPQIGLQSTTVDDVISERVAGQSKYTLAKMLSLAVNGITAHSVSSLPRTKICEY